MKKEGHQILYSYNQLYSTNNSVCFKMNVAFFFNEKRRSPDPISYNQLYSTNNSVCFKMNVAFFYVFTLQKVCRKLSFLFLGFKKIKRIIRPNLIRLIKNILQQYPDDSQIFKVSIINTLALLCLYGTQKSLH